MDAAITEADAAELEYYNFVNGVAAKQVAK
jgi:hypothetical protein